jgi:hypothetical protein
MNEFILVLLYPGCIAFEVALAAELLSRKFRILTVTPDGEDKGLLPGTAWPKDAVTRVGGNP